MEDTEIREENNRPKYLKVNYKNGDQSLIARFRCGNKKNGNRYWKRKEENKRRLCRKEAKTLDHILKECEKMD